MSAPAKGSPCKLSTAMPWRYAYLGGAGAGTGLAASWDAGSLVAGSLEPALDGAFCADSGAAARQRPARSANERGRRMQGNIGCGTLPLPTNVHGGSAVALGRPGP